MAASVEPAATRRSRGSFVAILVAGALCVAALLGLGTWQVHRLSWKLDLIARVDARVHAVPVAPPRPALWPRIVVERDEYLHITARGHYLAGDDTLVQAVTDLGPGFWVMTPFRTEDGFTVLVDRGFVPQDRRDPAARASGEIEGETTVTGLLRMTEPGGGFLRSNDAADDRWYSRDVAAIAAKRGLGPVAPYFIDADATPNAGGLPVGGLTIVAFPNNHLVYAITWYALAAMLVGAMVWRVREDLAERSSSRRQEEVSRRSRVG